MYYFNSFHFVVPNSLCLSLFISYILSSHHIAISSSTEPLFPLLIDWQSGTPPLGWTSVSIICSSLNQSAITQM